MPFVPSRFDPGRISEIPELPEQDQEGPKFFTEVVPAAFRLENMLGSAMAEEQAPRYERNILGQRVGVIYEGFNPFTEGDMTGYEDFADRFVGVHTETQFDAMKRQIDRELVDRRTIEESGVGGFVASLGASIVDPTVFLPVGGALSKGASVLQISRRAALAGGASTFVQEVGLQATQETRTLGESAINIGGATFLGGVLGGAVGLIGRRQLVNAGRQVEAEMRVPGQGEPDPIAPDEVLPPPEALSLEQLASIRVRRADAALSDADAEAEILRLDQEIAALNQRLEEPSAPGQNEQVVAGRIEVLNRSINEAQARKAEIRSRNEPLDFELDAQGNLIDIDPPANVGLDDFAQTGSFKAAHRGDMAEPIAPDDVPLEKRYDGDGGEFGNGLYLDEDGKWVSGSIDMFFYNNRVVGVEVNDARMFELNPESLPVLLREMRSAGVGSGQYIINRPGDVSAFLKDRGFDGVFMRGMDDMDKQLWELEFPQMQRAIGAMGVSPKTASGLFQDQVVLFNPQGKVRVLREGETEDFFGSEIAPDGSPLSFGRDGSFIDEFLARDREFRARGEERGLIEPRAPEPDLPAMPKAPGEARGVGAQAVAKGTSDQLQIDTAVARVLGRIASNPLKFIDPIAPAGVRKAAEIISSEPVTRTMLSPSVEARRLASGLTEIPSTLKGERATVNADGSVTFGQARRQSVETMIKLADAQLGRAFRMTDDIYVKYLRGRERRPGDIMVAGIEGIGGRRDGKLNKPQFEKEIARAMRRGDTSEIPEVQEAAERLRKEFFQPLEDQAVELRLFGEERVPNPDDPEGEDIWVPRRPSVEGTAESFMLRLYDREKIKRNRPAFTQIIYNHFVRKRADAVREAEQLEDAIVGAQEVVKTFWDATRNALSERNALARKARELRGRTDRQDANLKGREREAGVASRDAERRRQEIDNQSMTPADEAYFKGLLREVRRGHGDDKPRRLSQWVIDNGGILDPETQMPQSVLRRPGLVNRNVDDGSGRTRRGGVPLDNLREMAIEDGYYLPDGADAMNGGNLSDFVDMLVRDLNGDEVYAMNRPDVADAVHHMEYLRGVRDEMAEDGLDYTSVSAAEFGSWLAGAKLKQRTRFKKGQMKEALIREERAGQRLRKVQDDLEDFEVDQADSRAAARTMRELMPEKTEEANMARKQHRQARRELNAMRRELFKTQARAERTDEDLLADATRTVDNILANPAGRINNEGAGVHKVFRANTQLEYMSALSGRFKARALDIPDVEIEEFLDSELPTLMRALQRSMVPDMELIKRYGSIDLELELNQVAEDFQAQIFKVDQDPKYKTEKQRQARRATLENEMNDTMRDLMGVRDRLRGVYGMPTDPESLSERVASNLIHLNYLRLMGGVTISSLPDLPRAVMTYGVGKTAGTAFRALTGNFNTIKLLDDELKAAGTGFEMVLNTRIMEMTDLINDRGAKSALERFTHSATSQFGYASLIAPWNRAMKAIAGYGVQNRLLQAAMNTADGKATAADADLLVRLGFSEDNSRQLAAMYRQHGQTENGNLIARSDQWGNEDLRQMWLGALRKEVDDLVVTPGQNKPLLASTTWGRVLLNLRSYNMAATQKVMMRYAQGVITGREAHVYMMLMTQIGLGAAVAKIKADQYGLNTDNWNERKWMVEAIDRSGLLGAFTDINMMAEYATGGRVGLSAIAGQGRMSRYASRNMLGQFLGPSAGLASDATTALALGGDIAAKAFGDEEAEIYRSDIRAARRLLPYQNMWFLRDLFDRMEDDLGDALGATGESLAERRERMATEDA